MIEKNNIKGCDIIKKYLFFISFLFISLICISSVCATDLNNDYNGNEILDVSNNEIGITEDKFDVDKITTENVGISGTDSMGLAADNSFEYLNDTIGLSQGQLNLTKDYLFNNESDLNFTCGIVISNPIAINGNGHVIDAKGMARIFNITANNVVLSDIKFINAFGDNGGALHIRGEDVKIINCTFINDVATVEAGSIYLRAPRGQIINSTFINSAAYYTGAVLVNSENATVTGSYFENNFANVSAGALGWATKDNGVIKDCAFVNNAAYNEGGGAIFWNRGKNGIIENNTFIDNFANYDGAAIFWKYGDNGLITGCTFINNNATRKGGAIYSEGTNKTIYNSKFVNNFADEYGGAISAEDCLDIFNCSFDNNIAKSQGGAFYCPNAFVNSTISKSNFTNNYASDGAGIFIGDICENVKFIELNFENNTGDDGVGFNLYQVQDTDFNKINFINNSARSSGGAIAVSNEISDSNFCEINLINNSARVGAGFSFREVTFKNKFSRINAINNSVIYEGGAFFFLTDTNLNTFDEINFKNNYAGISGGALYCTLVFSRNNFTNCNFENNYAVESGGALLFYSDIGGSVIDNCNFVNNTAGYQGGAICCNMRLIDSIISNSNFTNNFAQEGAGILVYSICGNCEFIGLNFINNTADLGAGVIIKNTCDNVKFINQNFINNSGEYGVGIYISGEVYDSQFNKIEFRNNYAKDSGGAVFIRNAVYDSIFSEINAINNSAKNGGVFSFNGDMLYNSFAKMTFINNSATLNGGALFFITPVEGNMFDEMNFINNSAEKYGAVIYSHLLFVSNTITNSNFENNKAGLYGGLMFFQSDFAQNKFENSTIANNEAINGTVIYFVNKGLYNTFANLNVSENVAADSGLFYYNQVSADDFASVKFTNNNVNNTAILFFNGLSSSFIENCEFADNTVGDVSDIYYAGGADALIQNSIFNDKNNIYVSSDSNVNLINNTESNLYENSYFVLNNGDVLLNNNSLTNVIVNKGIILSKTSIYVLNNETVNVRLPDVVLTAYCMDDNGNYVVSDNMTFDINGEKLTVPMDYDVVAVAKYDLTYLGVYLVNATLSSNLSDCSYNTGIIQYLNKDPQMNVSDINITPDEYPEILVNIDPDATGMIIVEFNNRPIVTPVENGSALVILPKLGPGDYILNVYYIGDDIYAPQGAEVNIHIKSVTIDASNMVRGWNSAYDYQAKLLDENGTPVANKLMEFTIDGKQYYAVTNSNGTANIKPKLNVGEYDVIVSSPLTNQTITKTAKIVKRITNNKNLNVYYNSNKKYKVKIIGDDGKAESKGKSVSVYIDGKKRTYNTDKNGFITIKLNKNFKVGSHTIKIQYKGYSVQNKLTIKHLLTSKSIVTVKKSAKKVVLNAKLAKKLKNKVIKFKINGKTYKAKTNSKSIAKLSINKNKFKNVVTTVTISYLKDIIKTNVIRL